jgi:hypothetical protein
MIYAPSDCSDRDDSWSCVWFPGARLLFCVAGGEMINVAKALGIGRASIYRVQEAGG